MITVKLKKEPHAQQLKAIECSEPEQLYGGAKRGGKTIWLCQKAFLLNFLFPGNRGLMTRYNFTDLRDTTLIEFFETIPGEFIVGHNKGEKTIFLSNPHPESKRKDSTTVDGYSRWASRQHYRGLGDPDDFEKVKGMNLGHAEYDEPSEIPFEIYLMLRAQMTWQLPDGTRPPYMNLLASNPEPGWVEERFIETETEGCIFIPALPSDNPHLPPGYVEELTKTYPKEWVDKYVKGGWGASEGAVFKELDEEIHNLDNWVDPDDDKAVYEFSQRLDLLGGFDHGDTGVTCYIQGGVDVAHNMFFFDEYYQKNRLVSAHAIDILALKNKYEQSRYGFKARKQKFVVCDPTVISRKSQQSANGFQTIGELYIPHGLFMTAGWNAMEMSIERIKEHLHPLGRHRHPFLMTPGAPTLYISKKRSPMLWKEVRTWKRKRIEQRSSAMAAFMEYKGTDHAIDPLRYIVNAQPRRKEFCDTDMSGMTPQQIAAVKSHAKWAARFGKAAAPTTTSIFR